MGARQPPDVAGQIRGVTKMSKNHFRISSVEALPDYKLRLTFADDRSFDIDLTEWIETTKALSPLKNPTLFAKAKIGFASASVEWIEDELELAADNLRNLAIEQSGGIGHERIWNWLHKTGLTLDQAAAALGISRRMLIYYRDGEKPIPRHIWLACLGWEATRPNNSTRLPLRIPSVREYAAIHQ
jgi:hypothetical protein